MTKPIKFRAWDIDNQMMVYSQDPNYCFTILPSGRVFCWEIDGEELNDLHIDKNIMQFTGLTDKNGKEIYEGDICQVINPNGDIDRPCVVQWSQSGSCYPYAPEGGYGDFDVSSIGWAMDMEFRFEVIGNVWDNPELVEEKHEN